jgi:hypothetical protein
MAEYPFEPNLIGNPCQNCCDTCKKKQTDNSLKPTENCCYPKSPRLIPLNCYNTKNCSACITISTSLDPEITKEVVENICLDNRFKYINSRECKEQCIYGNCYSGCWEKNVAAGTAIPRYDLTKEICCDCNPDIIKPAPGQAKDSCYRCKNTSGTISVPDAQHLTYSRSEFEAYCPDDTDKKNTSCCWGTCFDENNKCKKCDDTVKKLIDTCPDPRDPKKSACCGGVCYDSDKTCDVCISGVLTPPLNCLCCEDLNGKKRCCNNDTPECCEGYGCFNSRCQECKKT